MASRGICGLEVKYGDGSDDSVQVESVPPNPIVLNTPTKGGHYKIRAKGERVKALWAASARKA